jgi:hypothetical protein
MESSRIMGGDASDNRRSTSPSGDLQQDGASQAPRDGTDAASEEAPLEDSSRETPSFASKEALENSSNCNETAMAGVETATASMEAPDSASNGQASKHAERNLQKVLVVDTKTPAPHSQEKGVYDIEMEHSGTVAHTTGNGASDHINTDSLPNNYTDFGAAEAGGALVGALLHNGDALLHDGSAFLVQEAGCASLREVHDSPALEGHFGGSLDIDGKNQRTEAETEGLQGTRPERPGVIHHEQDRQMVMMWKKLSKERKQNDRNSRK